jgi:hypothetical protein
MIHDRCFLEIATENCQMILIKNEHNRPGQIYGIVRSPQTPPVIVRSLGNRSFEEIPPSEIAEIMRHVRQGIPDLSRDELYRKVLQHYGLVGLTSPRQKELERIYERFLSNA